jgi:hypothetical protein
VGDIPLCDKLPRLYDLAVDKEGTVEEMSRLGWEEGVERGYGGGVY